ncbi:hypothetical protein BGX38DRAFT_1267596 [Terfezia claveryi]|nr:hypothetical protein BGX38DRAFT_1267596 [Terfezia claveryi]
MPQTTEKAQALYQIETEAENTVYADALASSSEDENDYEEDLEDLLTLREVIASDRYLLSRNTSAGRHDIDLLEAYIQDYPKGISEGISEGICEGISEGISNGISEGISECISEGISEGI